MAGRPVWLASMSLRNKKGIVATGKWSRHRIKEGEALLRSLLRDVGDSARMRLFRMNVTLCLHKALSDEDIATLPADFIAAKPIDLAGGPIEILWETMKGSESTRPCHAPKHGIFDRRREDLWIPLPCGSCPPCQARAAI